MRSSKVKNSTAKWNSYLIDIFKCRLWFLSIEVDGPALLQVQQLFQPFVQLILTVIKTRNTKKKLLLGTGTGSPFLAQVIPRTKFGKQPAFSTQNSRQSSHQYVQ